MKSYFSKPKFKTTNYSSNSLVDSIQPLSDGRIGAVHLEVRNDLNYYFFRIHHPITYNVESETRLESGNGYYLAGKVLSAFNQRRPISTTFIKIHEPNQKPVVVDMLQRGTLQIIDQNHFFFSPFDMETVKVYRVMAYGIQLLDCLPNCSDTDRYQITSNNCVLKVNQEQTPCELWTIDDDFKYVQEEKSLFLKQINEDKSIIEDIVSLDKNTLFVSCFYPESSKFRALIWSINNNQWVYQSELSNVPHKNIQMLPHPENAFITTVQKPMEGFFCSDLYLWDREKYIPYKLNIETGRDVTVLQNRKIIDLQGKGWKIHTLSAPDSQLEDAIVHMTGFPKPLGKLTAEYAYDTLAACGIFGEQSRPKQLPRKNRCEVITRLFCRKR